MPPLILKDMSCTLTQNIVLGCKDGVGGIKKIFVTELENKSAITAATGNITAFSLLTGKQFWTYDFEKETGEYTEKIVTSTDGSGTTFYEPEIKIRINKKDVSKRNELKLLAQNRVMIIVLDRNGIYWLAGEANGCDLAPSTAMAGKAFGDFNGYELTFSGKEENPAQTVASGLIAALTAPAVAP
jgi:hypothetical protein